MSTGPDLVGGEAREQVDPFAGQSAYFREPTREKRLNLIMHLLSYGEIVVVKGEVGSGRSRLLQQIEQQARPSWRVVRIEGAPTMSHDILEQALVAGLGLAVETGGADRVGHLRRGLLDLRQEHILPVCLVDDAELLPDSSLGLLADLATPALGEEAAMGIVLVIEKGASERVSSPAFTVLLDRVSHVFELPGLPELGTRDYILHCLRCAGATVGPAFSPSALRLIHRSSGGLPGRINPLARRLYWGGKADKARQEPVPVSVGRLRVQEQPDSRRVPVLRWRHAGFILLTGFLVLIWWQQDRVNDWFMAGQAPLNLPPGTEAPAAASQSPEARPPLGTQTAHAIAEPTIETTPAAESASTVMPSPATETATVPLAGFGTEEALVTTGSDSPGHARASPPMQADVTAVLPLAGQESGAPAVGSMVAALPPSNAGTASTASSSSSSSLHEKDEKDEVDGSMARPWLSSRSPDHFTLQLVALQPAAARRFIIEHGLEGEASLLPRRGAQGQVLEAVVYGDFADRTAALRRSRELAARIPGLAPWLRRFADIQAEIGHPGAHPGR